MAIKTTQTNMYIDEIKMFVAAIAAFFISFIDALTQPMQFAFLILSVGIAGFKFQKELKEFLKRRKNEKDKRNTPD